MSQYLDWKVGDRVVCIDDLWENKNTHSGRAYPECGRVYTIASMAVDIVVHGVLCRGLWIGVSEVSGNWDGEPEFSAKCFRKVQPRETDISCFTALLNGAKERERV